MTLAVAQPAPASAACPLAELCPDCWPPMCEECGPICWRRETVAAAPEPDPEETDARA